MLLVLQLILYCLLFLLLVKCAAKNSGRNCLYFYPADYIREAQNRGLADQAAESKKGKLVMIALLLIIAVWNGVTDFKTAYLQSYLFLVVMNWFDGIVIDRLWVGHSKIWKIEGMEGVPYLKPWKTVLIKRGLGTLLYLLIALAVAGIVVLIGSLR